MGRAALILAALVAACDGGGGAPDARPLVDAGSAGCDTVKQDCPAQKCTLIQMGSAGVPRCATIEGFVGAGQACERRMDVGLDDCAPGLYCSGLGFAVVTGQARARVCRRFCRDATTCEAGEACIKLSGETPPDGICVPASCTLYGGCESDMTCDAVETTGAGWAGICRSPGTAKVGELCVTADCVADAHCQGGATAGTAMCLALCDDAHACAAGTCAKLAGLPAGGGVCR